MNDSSNSIEANGKRLKKTCSLLAAGYAQKIREEKVAFKRMSNKTIGLCCFCEQKKSMTKSQWQAHLLAHTKEKPFYCCNCQCTFAERTSHPTCSLKSIRNIYELNGCLGDQHLDVFMCDVCDYARVSKRKMILHVRSDHNGQGDEEELLKKFKFVTNVY